MRIYSREQFTIHHIADNEFGAHVRTDTTPRVALETLVCGCGLEKQECYRIESEHPIMVVYGPKEVFERLVQTTRDEIEGRVWHSDGCCALGR
jgi:hypothetical protein